MNVKTYENLLEDIANDPSEAHKLWQQTHKLTKKILRKIKKNFFEYQNPAINKQVQVEEILQHCV